MVTEATEGRGSGGEFREGRWSFRAMPSWSFFSFELSKWITYLKNQSTKCYSFPNFLEEGAPRPWAPTDMHLGLCLRRALFHSSGGQRLGFRTQLRVPLLGGLPSPPPGR